MKALFVGIRLKREELCALIQALRLSPPAGAPLEPLEPEDIRQALHRLADQGRVMIAGEAMVLEKPMLKLLEMVTGAEDGLAIRGAGEALVLWRWADIYVLGDFPESGACTLTPLQNLQEAREALEDRLTNFNGPLRAENPFDPARQLTVDDPAADSLMSLLRPTQPEIF